MGKEQNLDFSVFHTFNRFSGLTWRDVYSIFPPIASIMLIVAFWNKKRGLTRIFGFISSVCMFVYGWHYYSVATVVNEVLTQASIFIAVITEKRCKTELSARKDDSTLSSERLNKRPGNRVHPFAK